MTLVLTPDEAGRLSKESPQELARRAFAERRDFVFGLRDERLSFGRDWGGEFRVFVNQNIVLHLVPRFTEEMWSEAELPQFAVMPDDARAGEDRTHAYEGWKDLDPFDGVVFFVSREDYKAIIGELAGLAARFDDAARLPDTLFPGARFAKLIAGRVLEHPVVAAERAYDFSKRTF